MQTKTIVFTAPKTAEYRPDETKVMEPHKVAVKMEYTVISGGTERASIMAMPNAGGNKFPKYLGYCGVGIVVETGDAVKNTQVGDRVLVYHGRHSLYNVIPESDVTKVPDHVDPLEASFVIIASMGLGGLRRLRLELGESGMVMGLGLLGTFALQFMRLSGAYPVIAADLNPARRALALQLGADYALDPAEPDFTDKVKALTGDKGVNGTVEVTGNAKALQQALGCAAREGRISLLGCTRISDCPIDFYQQVHRPGIQLIGAHNMVRPKLESRPYEWTHQDDCKAILALLGAGRIQVKPIISRVVKPADAPAVYTQLCDDPAFPMGTVFDWRNETC